MGVGEKREERKKQKKKREGEKKNEKTSSQFMQTGRAKLWETRKESCPEMKPRKDNFSNKKLLSSISQGSYQGADENFRKLYFGFFSQQENKRIRPGQV